MFLSKKELEELTGFVRAAKQIEWLRANGWRYAEDSQHRPKVARSYFEVRLGGAQREPDVRASDTVAPRFEALRAVRTTRGVAHGA
ncbi:DUF4224 domain-containing protein [Pandoraea cepalis]|uniref:DUF4224 domain-containing protein n=1 Tax=Pandoraea cepalis TaxID=2508294 RepID=A0A5E4YNR6_9BURK|nr:DUF4224 domain-containing protein [Pandoraea cepalis]VVE50459.1 hypothetical protein PCE31107_04671 [Pandoraea cepalis]